MIAAQTLNLHKYYKNNNIAAIRLQITMAIMSSFLLKKHYDRVILYADKKTAEILSNTYYTEIRILPTDVLVSYGYGTLAKLYTYSNIEEEFIHFDVDYFLFKKVNLNDEIICSYSENREKCGVSSFEAGYSCLIDKLKVDYQDLGFKIIDEDYAMNMCIFGVPQNYHKSITEYFKKLNEHSEKNIETISNNYTIDYPPLWAIEQYIPAQFFLENNFKINELNDYDNHHIKGQSGYLRIFNVKTHENIANFRIKDVDIKFHLSKYMEENIGHHLWNTKNVEGIDDSLRFVAREMFSELYEVIINILDKNSLLINKNTDGKRLI